MNARTTASAVKRLLRDLKELEEEPVVGVTVTIPDEKNIFKQRVCLQPQEGPRQGDKFYMMLSFPPDYPNNPPHLKLHTRISRHPNVFGDWVCLNMLRPPAYGLDYSGWSSAYSLTSIAMQLQTFLFAKSVPQDGGGSVKNNSTVWRRSTKEPLFDKADKARNSHSDHKQQQEVGKADTCSHLADVGGLTLIHLPDEMLLKICESLPVMADLAALFRSCKRTMETYNEWLPLLLNPAHAKNALSLAKGTLVRLATGIALGTSVDGINLFKPAHALEVLPKMMNSMVVAFMKGKRKKLGEIDFIFDFGVSFSNHRLVEQEMAEPQEKAASAQVSPLMASERALKAYCACHHLLLQLAASFPEITAAADYWLSEFLRHDSRRNKAVISDLGELLVLLAISEKHTWAEIAELFLREVLCRNVRWYLISQVKDPVEKIYPELAYIEDTSSINAYRLEHTYNATQVSRQLLMFQVTFLRLAGRPEGSPPEEMLNRYNQNYGHPAPGMAGRLQSECKKMAEVHSWEGYLGQLGIEYEGSLAMCQMLRESVVRSEQKGYHRRHGPSLNSRSEQNARGLR
eukprot:gene10904-12901_t